MAKWIQGLRCVNKYIQTYITIHDVHGKANPLLLAFGLHPSPYKAQLPALHQTIDSFRIFNLRLQPLLPVTSLDEPVDEMIDRGVWLLPWCSFTLNERNIPLFEKLKWNESS